MRITALISFFFLFALTTQSQTTIFNGSFSIREITGSSPSYTVDGFFQSEGTYIGTDIQEGDRIYFWHGNDCDYLVVDTVYYAYANIVNLGLSDPDTTFLSIPTGKGLMTRLTDYYNFSIPFTADVPDVLKKCVGGKLINEIDQIRPQTSFYADSIFLDTTGLTFINDTVLQVALEQIDSALFDINDSLDSIPRGSGTSGTLTKWTGTNTIGDAAITENATRLSASLPFRLANIPTVSLPGVPLKGDVVLNETVGNIGYYVNTWEYPVKSSTSTGLFTATRIPFADANGRLTDDAEITFVNGTTLQTSTSGNIHAAVGRIASNSGRCNSPEGGIARVSGTGAIQINLPTGVFGGGGTYRGWGVSFDVVVTKYVGGSTQQSDRVTFVINGDNSPSVYQASAYSTGLGNNIQGLTWRVGHSGASGVVRVFLGELASSLGTNVVSVENVNYVNNSGSSATISELCNGWSISLQSSSFGTVSRSGLITPQYGRVYALSIEGGLNIQRDVNSFHRARYQGSFTGAHEITLPPSTSNLSGTDVPFQIKGGLIFGSISNLREFILEGTYNYSTRNFSSCSVQWIGGSPANIPVRFGDDGTSGKIWIGELATSWTGSFLYIYDLVTYNTTQSAHQDFYANFPALQTESTAFNNVDVTVTGATAGAIPYVSTYGHTYDANFFRTATQFKAGNYIFNIDQSLGAGQNGYALRWNNSTGEFEASADAAGYTGFTPAADNGAGDDIESGDILTIEGDVDIETEITSQTISIRNKWNPALIFYVSAFGDDATGQRGNPQRPFLNFSTAVDSCEAVSGSWIYVNDGAHTFTSAGDTLTGLNVFIDAAATLAARVQSGLFYAEGKFTVTYRPQSSSNLTQIYGNHVVLGMDMTLGGSIEVDAGIIEVSSGGDFAGTSTKNVRFNSNILLQQEVGEFGGDMSSLNYAAQCNILRSNSAALFAFGDGSTTTAMNDNRVSLKANRSEMGSTIGLFFIDIPADGSFARNKINIEINEWTKAGQIISTSANVRQLATNGSSSLINVHLGSFHSTVTSGTDVIGISTTSKDDQFLTPFIISGHIMSDSLPVLAVTGTLGIGFQFENTTLEVRKAGVNVVDIATLNTSSTYLLSFTNSNLRNDGSTAKIDITTATTIPQGNYYDLNSSYNVFLDYGNNNRSADDLSKTRSGLVLAPATDGTVYETGGVLFTQTAIDTVTNTASETSLINTGKGSVTLPANYLEEGRDIKCEAWGTVTTNGSPPSLELNLKLGSTAVWDSGSFSMIDLSAGIETWYANISFTTYTEGVSGTVMPAGEFSFFVGGDPSFGKVIRPVYASPVTINTTTSQTIDFTATWGSADVNASIVMTKFVCKAEN